MVMAHRRFCIHRFVIAGCIMAAGFLAAARADAESSQSRVQCKISSGGPPDLVIKVCNEVIQFGHEIGSRLAGAYISRARAYRVKGEYDRAIADLSQALKNDPGNVLAMHSRGVAYSDKQDYDRAIADYTEALWLAPRDATLFNDRARAYERKAQYDRAIADYSEVIRIAPRPAAALKDRCYVRAISGRELPQALEDCNEALRLIPRDISAFERRALTYVRLGRYDKAIVDYNLVLKFVSTNAAALYGRGVAKKKTGDEYGGDADIAAARLIRPDIVEELIRFGVK